MARIGAKLAIAMAFGIAAASPVCLPAEAQAQTRDAPESRSRELFTQAVGLADQGRWTEACPLFQAAHDLNATGGTALQTANCYEKIGKLERALEHYEFILSRPDAKKNPERVAIAEERVRALREALGKTAAPPSKTEAPQTSGGAATSPPSSSDSGSGRTAGFIALGAGGVGLAVGALFGALALSQASDVKATCSENRCPKSSEQYADAAIAKGWVSTIAFGAGAAGVALGVVLLATSGGEKPRSVTADARGIAVHF
jgi:tetratricopeptide (TPR) repeat protein